MIDRREMLLGGAMLAALPTLARAGLAVPTPLPVPAGDRLGFDIVRKGSKLGTHDLSFVRSGDDLTVKVVVDLVVKIAFITVYRYSHRATERWSGGEVVALDTTTNDNGDKFTVTGRRDKSGLVIEATKLARYTAPADALPATHWNRRQLDGPWINTQTGKLMRPKVTPIGADTIPGANGPLRASHYAITGEVQLDMWYDRQAEWAGLSFVGKDGTSVRYLRR